MIKQGDWEMAVISCAGSVGITEEDRNKNEDLNSGIMPKFLTQNCL
jgi:hypothetical protein